MLKTVWVVFLGSLLVACSSPAPKEKKQDPNVEIEQVKQATERAVRHLERSVE